MPFKAKLPKNIEYRGDNQYRVNIRRNGIIERRTFDTLEAAKKWQELMIGKIAGDDYVDRSKERRTTLAELLQRYLKDETPKKKGAKKEVYVINAWLREDFTKLPIVSIDPSYFTKWRDEKVAEGKAPSTIYNAMNLMSAVYRVARTEWGYLIDNPLTGIARPKQRPAREVFFNLKEEAKLLEHCSTPGRPAWLLPMVTLALWTAMRQGEIRQLRWEWINLEAGLVILPDDVIEKGVREGVVKNGDGRGVVLVEEAETALRSWAGDVVHISGPVFQETNDNGEKYEISQDRISKHFALVAAAAGRPDITFHDLRHVATTKLKLIHDDALHLSKTTGHKDLRSLARYYNPDPVDNAKRLRERAKAKF